MRWLPVGAGVAAAAALVLGGVVLLQRGDTGHTASTSAGPTYRTNSSGTDYRKDGKLLASELPALLGGAALAEAVPGPAKQSSPLNGATVPQPAGAASIDALADLHTTRGLASCLASLSDAKDPGLPLALDYASFEGEPALVVVLPASKPDKVDVFVVGAACSVADAKVLFFTRLAKPS